MTGSLRALLRGLSPASQLAGAARSLAIAPRAACSQGSLPKEAVRSRHSNGLEQFFNYIRGQAGLSILDLAEANQANINFITNLGQRLYSEDFLTSLDATFGPGDLGAQSNPGLIESFLRQNLNYSEEQFDGVLVWDALEHLAPPLLAATLERLYTITKPKSYLFAIFNARERLDELPVYSFRIGDSHTLLLSERGVRRPAQLFNNRNLEKLFQKFESVKFFLTRENLREVIVKR